MIVNEKVVFRKSLVPAEVWGNEPITNTFRKMTYLKKTKGILHSMILKSFCNLTRGFVNK